MTGISFRNKSNFLNLIPPKWGQSPFEFEYSMLHHWYLNIDFLLRSRGWCIKFATGLNIIISLVQKVYEWPGWFLPKWFSNALQWGDHFDKRTAWFFICFLNYVYYDISPCRKFDASLSSMYLSTIF